MSGAEAEAIVLENLVPELEAQGYDVFVRPSREIVPRFLGSFRPDLIALRGDGNLIVEVMTSKKSSLERLKTIAKLIDDQDRWTLRIVGTTPSQQRFDLLPEKDEEIAERLDEVTQMLSAGFVDSALLLCWASFEAIGRRLMPNELSRPQPPAQLVETLASQGYVTPDEADTLRTFASMRSRLAHGDFSVRARRRDVEAFIHIVEPLLEPTLSPGPTM